MSWDHRLLYHSILGSRVIKYRDRCASFGGHFWEGYRELILPRTLGIGLR